MASTIFVGLIVGGTTVSGSAGDGIAAAIHAGMNHPPLYAGSPPVEGAAFIGDLQGAAQTVTLTGVAPDAETSFGGICAGWVDDIYNRIHVIPSVLNLGNVLANQNQDVEVWNSHFVSKTLSVINETSTQGITLLEPSAPPLLFNAQASFKAPYSVLITTDGPAVIDAEYEFDFTTEAPTLSITGQRVISFPFDFQKPFQERLGFLTDVQEADDGAELRVRARKLPRTTLKVDYLLPDSPKLRSQILNRLYGSQGKFFAVPMFQWGRDLLTDLSIGVSVIPVDTTLADFRDSTVDETHSIMLWRSETDFEILQIAVGGLADAQITIDLPTTIAHTAGDTLVLPLEVALSQDPIQWAETRNNRITISLQWLLEDVTDLADLSSLPTMPADGLPVFDDSNFMDKVLEQTLDKNYFLMDNMVGPVLAIGGRAAPQYSTTKGFNTRNAADAWTLRQVLYGLRGKQKSFWLSSFRDDFVIVDAIGAGDTNLVVERVDYNLFVAQIGSWRGLRLELNDGTVFYRQIVASDVAVDPEEEQITIDSSLGQIVAVEDIRQTSLLMMCRSGTDNVDIFWSSVSNLQVRLPIKGIPA